MLQQVLNPLSWLVLLHLLLWLGISARVLLRPVLEALLAEKGLKLDDFMDAPRAP